MTVPRIRFKVGSLTAAAAARGISTSLDSSVALNISDIEAEMIELTSKCNSMKQSLKQLESHLQSLTTSSSASRSKDQSKNVLETFQTIKRLFDEYEAAFQARCNEILKAESMKPQPFPHLHIANLKVLCMREYLRESEKYRLILQELLSSPGASELRSKRRKLSEEGRRILVEWFEDHIDNPFPSPEEKERLAEAAHASVDQITIWFINMRARRGTGAGGHSRRQNPDRKRVRETEFLL